MIHPLLFPILGLFVFLLAIISYAFPDKAIGKIHEYFSSFLSPSVLFGHYTLLGGISPTTVGTACLCQIDGYSFYYSYGLHYSTCFIHSKQLNAIGYSL